MRHRVCLSSQEAKIHYQKQLGEQEDRDQKESGLASLMPEEEHTGGGTERSEECNQQKQRL